MTNLIKQTDDASYRARVDRSIQSGRVVLVNRVNNTVALDVGMVDNNGAAVYLLDVPFSPQTPPQLNDTVAVLRTNSSPYSHVVGSGAQVGGANSGQVVKAGGAVTSLAKSGSAGLQGDVTLTGAGGIALTQVGQNIAIDGSSISGGGGSGGAPSTAHFLTTQSESGLTNEYSLGMLITGMLKHTVSAGVSTPSTAVPGVDFYEPGTSGSLDTISGLLATHPNILQSVSGVWASRTPLQVTATLPSVVGDSGIGGTKGLVPAPTAGDASKFFKGSGAFALIAAGDLPASSVILPAWIVREVPSGSINSSNAVFTLAVTPVLGTEHVFLNGLLQQSGGADYAISGAVITFVSAPLTGDSVLVTYQSVAGTSTVGYDSLDFSISTNSMYVPLVF